MLKGRGGKDTIGNQEEERNYEATVGIENHAKNEHMPREVFALGLALGDCLTSLPIQAHSLGGDIRR